MLLLPINVVSGRGQRRADKSCAGCQGSNTWTPSQEELVSVCSSGKRQNAVAEVQSRGPAGHRQHVFCLLCSHDAASQSAAVCGSNAR